MASRRTVSPTRFLKLAAASLGALFVVVTSGAFVRLTDSGLGCENWPRCGDRPYPEQGFHAFVEFGNRLVALVGIVLTLLVWLASRRVEGLPRWVRWTALGTFLGTVAQIPLGGVTVILELDPLAVMSHFLLALVVVAAAAVVVVEAWSHASGRGSAVEPRALRLAAVALVPLCLVLVVTGAVSTASGPHAGAEDVQRLGIEIVDAVYVHVRASAVFGITVLAVALALFRRRESAPGLWKTMLLLLAVLVVQLVLGEVQYRNALPWGLVLGHVLAAATIWTLTIALAHAMWRPPSPLVAAMPSRETAGKRALASSGAAGGQSGRQ